MADVSKAELTLYDTTLRDGAQREGLTLSVEDKLKITRVLDRFGFDYIEGGWPHPANPKDTEYFERVGDTELENAKMVAFGSTRRKNMAPEEDINLQALVEAGTKCVCIFGKSWAIHVATTLVTTLEENLRMIEESVGFLKERGLEVVYDAEHFFDAYKDSPDYAMDTVAKAAEAGADWIVLCDTNGGT
ncbi:MAG: citramalate synthase, partial [Terriglobia bacterium]